MANNNVVCKLANPLKARLKKSDYEQNFRPTDPREPKHRRKEISVRPTEDQKRWIDSIRRRLCVKQNDFVCCALRTGWNLCPRFSDLRSRLSEGLITVNDWAHFAPDYTAAVVSGKINPPLSVNAQVRDAQAYQRKLVVAAQQSSLEYQQKLAELYQSDFAANGFWELLGNLGRQGFATMH